MAIYEACGFSSLLYPYKGNLTPFEYIAQFKPMKVPERADIGQFKRTQAPYCISGKVTADKKGTHRRNNNSLVYRDLIFLDYDELEASTDLPKIVSNTLSEYSYIIYPTIKHTAKKPRYRLVVKPDKNLSKLDYTETVKQIADLIGLPYDQTSETWAQLQGLPCTQSSIEDYDRVVNLGTDFPTIRGQTVTTQATSSNFTLPSGQLSITMKVINTLFNGYGTEGGRNVAMTKFVGLLLNKYVNCDIEMAYDLALIANENTDPPLTIDELDTTFKSILQAEMRKRGKTL